MDGRDHDSREPTHEDAHTGAGDYGRHGAGADVACDATAGGDDAEDVGDLVEGSLDMGTVS